MKKVKSIIQNYSLKFIKNVNKPKEYNYLNYLKMLQCQ